MGRKTSSKNQSSGGSTSGQKASSLNPVLIGAIVAAVPITTALAAFIATRDSSRGAGGAEPEETVAGQVRR